MNEDVIVPWLLQRSTILTALLAGLAPAMVANFKRRSMMPWYLYGFACTLVAWPLITLPTIHAFLLRPRILSPEPGKSSGGQTRWPCSRKAACNLIRPGSQNSDADRRRESIAAAISTRRLDRASRSNSFANSPISATSTPWHFGIAAFSSAMCPADMDGWRMLSLTGLGWF